MFSTRGTQEALGEKFAFTGGVNTLVNVWTECPGLPR